MSCRKYLLIFITTSNLFLFSDVTMAEIVKFKCNEFTFAGTPMQSFKLINTSTGTINGERYDILDVGSNIVTYQKKATGSLDDQTALVEINRETGKVTATWHDGSKARDSTCDEQR